MEQGMVRRGDNDRLVLLDNYARLANDADAATGATGCLVELVKDVKLGRLQLDRNRLLGLLDNDRVGDALRCRLEYY